MKITDKNCLIGVVGLGHLGSSIVEALLNGGVSQEKLMVSFKGSKSTLKRAQKMGIASCLTDTKKLMSKADIIILAAKPQDFAAVSAHSVRKDALVMSFMAAIPLRILEKSFDCHVCRVMCSGPETITSGHGAAVLLPSLPLAESVLAAASVNIFQVSSESEIDAFTVGICIPPILMNIEISEKARRQAILAMKADFPVYQRLGEWIELELQAAAADKKESCLENVSTKGGISEAMINSLQNDGSFARALERGMKRCREICAAISAKLDANAA